MCFGASMCAPVDAHAARTGVTFAALDKGHESRAFTAIHHMLRPILDTGTCVLAWPQQVDGGGRGERLKEKTWARQGVQTGPARCTALDSQTRDYRVSSVGLTTAYGDT